jgi:hypothetical protein
LEILAKVNLFLGQPGSILNRLLDVFLFQVRVALKNFLERRSVRDLTHNYGDRYAHSAYACSPAHDLGVEGDSVEHNKGPPGLDSYRGLLAVSRIQRLHYDSQALEVFGAVLVSLVERPHGATRDCMEAKSVAWKFSTFCQSLVVIKDPPQRWPGSCELRPGDFLLPIFLTSTLLYECFAPQVDLNPFFAM